MRYTTITAQNAAGTALTSSTTETVIPTAAQCQGSRTIPANFLKVGNQIRVRARGIYSTPTGSDTINMRARYGGTGGVQLAATGAVDPGLASTAFGWDIDVVLTVRSIGASGTVVAAGGFHVRQDNATNGTNNWFPMGANTTITIDTTVATTIDLTAQWSASLATLTITCSQYTVEVIA